MNDILVIARAVSSPLRLGILQMIGEKGMSLSHIADAAGVSPGTAHHHLSRLIESGLASKARRGREVFYRWGRIRVSFMAETVPEPASQEEARGAGA